MEYVVVFLCIYVLICLNNKIMEIVEQMTYFL